MPPLLLDIVVPIRVMRVEPAGSKSDSPAATKSLQAGHEEGRLRAEWQARREREEERKRVQALVRKLENLHREYEALLETHLPDLIHGALGRVFRQHAFTAEEVGAEVRALLREMEQAGRIALECAPGELEALRRNLEECDSIPHDSKWTLAANETLAPGEFLLKSDLGHVDGRHSSRLRQIHLAVESSS